MKKLLIIIPLLTLVYACDLSPNSNDTSRSAIDNKNTNQSISDTTNDSAIHLLKTEVKNKNGGLNLFDTVLGKWIFMKRFIDKDRSIDALSFSIIRENVDSAGYAYFVHFSNDEQDELLTQQDDSTFTYGDNGYGTFVYDAHKGHLLVKISDISDAEYRKSSN